MMKDSTFMFLWSCLAIVVGLLIIINYNVLEVSWVVLLKLIGYGFVS